MVAGSCPVENCTIAATGVCLLHPTVNECPNFIPAEPQPGERSAGGVGVVPSGPVREFHSGIELGTLDAADLMRSRYASVITVLGATDAGKTCLLGSLYLLTSINQLGPRFSFAGSRSLRGFEDRIRLTRRWEKGRLPQRLALHTVLSDPREPALLHLCLADSHSCLPVDFLFTDIPGEWSSDLVTFGANDEKFGFLRRTDGVLVVVDSIALGQPTRRHGELVFTRQLLQRLAQDAELPDGVPVIITLSKCDQTDTAIPDCVTKLVEVATSLGLNASAVATAAYSETPDSIPSGHGLAEILEKLVSNSARPALDRPASSSHRIMARFR